MELLEKIYNRILLTESASEDEVIDALDNHKRVIINYHSKGEDNNTGARVIEVYAYGLTKAGNPCIRAFQPYGDTTTRVPSWKFFRLDRISAWQPTDQTFTRPADFYYKNLGEFNPQGDETMSVVYKIANFDNDTTVSDTQNSDPKTKEDVYKTSTETNMERFKQQTDNPITLSDIKANDAFKQLDTKPNPNGEPKTKEDVTKPYTPNDTGKTQQQMPTKEIPSQPQSDRTPREKTPEEKENELEKLRNILKDNPMSLSDLSKRMKEQPQQTRWQDVFDDQAENDLQKMQRNDMRNQRRRDNRWNKSVDTRPLGNRKGSLNRAFEK